LRSKGILEISIPVGVLMRFPSRQKPKVEKVEEEDWNKDYGDVMRMTMEKLLGRTVIFAPLESDISADQKHSIAEC